MAKRQSKKKPTRSTRSRSKDSKKAPRKKTGLKAATPGGPSRASTLTTEELDSELRIRRRKLPGMIAKRDRLLAQAAELSTEIAALGGPEAPSTTTGTRKRPQNTRTLPDALYSILRGREMRVSGAAEAVQAAGYQTNSANFTTIVNQTLLSDKRFRKVSHGVYTAK